MRLRSSATVLSIALIAGCSGGGSSFTSSGGGGSSGSGSGSGSGSTQYVSAYKSAKWGSATTVSFPSSCSMTLTTTGVPTFHNDYYLAPVSSEFPTVVAVTPVSKTEMSVIPYMSSSIAGATVTFNICPTKAARSTATNMGAIGYTISGEALFNPYEADGTETPALSDNVSYSFTTSAGVSETASFIDGCNSHAAQGAGGSTWHYHGVPTCLAAQLDGASGPSHLIGIALDGYPIYGGRDINGNVISVSQLDACNGITSATPEFPSGAYHYVLPIGVTGKQSSLNCYTGTVSSALVARESKYLCGANLLKAHIREASLGPRRRRAS